MRNTAAMKTPGLYWLACFSTVLTGLNAGFFYTWSFTMTGSLDLIDPVHAITAMNSINANIRTGWFALIFFGAPLALLITTGAAFARYGSKAALWWLAAFALLAMTIIITTQVHVPMNNALAIANNTDSATQWSQYSTRWTNWNHLRTLTSTLALIVAIIATARCRQSDHRS